eukprot:scaffold2423_cov116-Cylindrotheca_fusiformis.AAC.1
MKSRAERKAAMAKFRAAKRKRELEKEDDVFEGNIKEEGDVYDIVDEETYRELVNTRRQREDFVVDDDGLNYHDDGEERFGDEMGVDSRQKKRSGTAALTANALKKVRRQKAAIQAATRGASSAVEEEEDEVVASNRSMCDFVQRGASSNASSNTLKSSTRKAPVAVNAQAVDDVLAEFNEYTLPSRVTSAIDVSSFVADEIAAESNSAVSPASADLESYICKDDENERYLDMFWLDAKEQRGDIYLYGKVASKDVGDLENF